MARKNSVDSAGGGAPKKPKKRRWYHQVWDVYKLVRREQPSITAIMIAIIVAVPFLGWSLGHLWGHPVYTMFVTLPFGLLGAMFLLARRAEKVSYRQIEGQPGAVAAALGTIRRGWSIAQEPVAIDARTQDMVFRAIGRPGVVLVSEGPPARASRLLEAEKRRVNRLTPGVPVHLVQCGDGPDQVPLAKIASAVQRLKGKLSKAEVAEIDKRLTALGKVRMPIPKGIDPMRMRPDRKGMRGR